MKIQLPITTCYENSFQVALKHLCQERHVPKSEAWSLAKTFQRVERSVNRFSRKRLVVVNKHAEPDPENPLLVTVSVARKPAFLAEMNALIASDPTVESCLEKPIKLIEPLPADSTLTAEDLVLLIQTGLVEDPEPCNENDSQESTETAAAPSEEVRDGSNPAVAGVPAGN